MSDGPAGPGVVCDPGTFRADGVAADGVLRGEGRVRGVPTVVFATDPGVQGGAMGWEGCAAIVDAYDRALAGGMPVVGVWQSGGARLREGVASLDGVGRVFAAMTRASGRVPQVSLVVGPAAGGAAYGPALTDVVVLGPAARVFVTGPDVVRSVTGEDVDARSLGGPEPHARHSGMAHVVAADDAEAVRRTRRVVSLLASPGRVREEAVRDVGFSDVLPESPRRAYDVHLLVERLLDGPGLELQAHWAPSMLTALGRFGGGTVGVLANNPIHRCGTLDTTSAEKAARFVRTCDAFGIPLVVVVDVPGYMPGVRQEWDGVVRRGAKLLHAFAEARVPRVTLITRKAYGGAYIAMNSRALGATAVLAWPTAEIAVMGSVAAVRILHRRRLAAASPAERHALEAELADQHATESGGLDRAVRMGVVDEVVDFRRTRRALARHLAHASPERGVHGNIPL